MACSDRDAGLRIARRRDLCDPRSVMNYFAYGSNIDRAQWVARCPSSPFIAIARLDHHVLHFPRHSPVRNCAVASVAPSPGGVVWGVLYRMTAADLTSLDAREGHLPDRPDDSRYARAMVSVDRLDGQVVEALTYVANPSPDPGRTSADYMRHLIEGATHHGFPEDYVAMLRAIPTVSEP